MVPYFRHSALHTISISWNLTKEFKMRANVKFSENQLIQQLGESKCSKKSHKKLLKVLGQQQILHTEYADWFHGKFMLVPTKLCFLLLRATKEFCFKQDFTDFASLLKFPESLVLCYHLLRSYMINWYCQFAMLTEKKKGKRKNHQNQQTTTKKSARAHTHTCTQKLHQNTSKQKKEKPINQPKNNPFNKHTGPKHPRFLRKARTGKISQGIDKNVSSGPD